MKANKTTDASERPLDLIVRERGSRRAEPAEQCPNCGNWYALGSCRHSSSIKTAWGGSTLYGVCAECADKHTQYGNALSN